MQSYRYKATVSRVVDGDTVDLIIELGFHMTTKQRIRLLGIDAPEIRGSEKEAGRKSTAYLAGLLMKDGGEIEVETVKTGKFGRWLGLLYVDGLESSINTEMIKAGHAVEYAKA